MNNKLVSNQRHYATHSLSGKEILRILRTTLSLSLGHRMTLEALGEIIGKGTSTTGYWFEVYESPQVAGLVHLLERLSDEERRRFLHSVCRSLPTLFDPSLIHSPNIVADLLELLRHRRGLTLIRGGDEVSRGFVVSALGHTFPRLHPRHLTAKGLDLHPQDKFVPVESMHYFRSTKPDLMRQSIIESWRQILKAPTPLLLLNGVWSAVPTIREEILMSARVRNVVVVDQDVPNLKEFANSGIEFLQSFTLTAHANPFRIRLVRQVWKKRGRPSKNRS